MKRLLKFLFVLVSIAVLLAGGFALRHYWDQLDPFNDRSADKEHLQQWLVQLRHACVTEDALRGVALREHEEDGTQIKLFGIVAKQEQIPLVEAKARALLNDYPRLAEHYPGGFATAGLQVFPIHEQLPRLQADFHDGKGATGELDAMREKRMVLSATRLDDVAIRDDGKLRFRGVCVRGDAKQDVSQLILFEAIRDYLLAHGALASALPDISTAMEFHDHPVAALQKRIAREERWQDVHVLAGWYERDGKLHLEGLLGKEEQRKPVEEAIASWLQDPALKPIWHRPGANAFDADMRMVTFDAEARTRALQQEVVRTAQKENKPDWQRVRILKVIPKFALDNSAKSAPEFPIGTFQVTGQYLDKPDMRKRLESELPGWLQTQMPKLVNADRSPILARLELTALADPVEALQQKVVQRKLDGTVFIDARYDGVGNLEFHGRLSEPGEKTKQELRDAVQEMLEAYTPWTLDTLQAHETREGAQPIAWNDVLRGCQGRLAKSDGAGKRTRLDRLYFRHEIHQLRLDGAGVFLEESANDKSVDLNAVLDEVIASRGSGAVVPTLFKHLPHPMAGWQQKVAEQTALDGTVLTQLRYDADGLLQIDGFIGSMAQKESLRNLLSAQLAQLPDALKRVLDKDPPAWSITGFAAHQSLQGKEQQWSDLLRTYQTELSSSDEAGFRHMRLDRASFLYRDNPRRLTLQWKATRLVGPKDDVEMPVLKKQIDTLGKKFLPTLALAEVEPAIQTIETPIYDLQAVAVTHQLDGVLFKDAFFNAEGKLQFAGYRGSDLQPKMLQPLVEPVLDAKSKSLGSAGMAPLDRLKLIPWKTLIDDFRKTFSTDASPLLQQTRIDRLFFQYDEGKTTPRLWIKGVSIYQGKNPPANEQSAKWNEALKDRLKPRDIDRYELVFDALAVKDNPSIELQRKVIADQLDGVVFRVVGFDAGGILRIRALTPKGQEENVRKLLEEAAKKHPYLAPIEQPPLRPRGETSASDGHFTLFTDASGANSAAADDGAFDWQKMLAELRTRFASSTEPLLQQTRIDRAYFSLNEADPDQPPFLNFKGVSLRTVHDDEKKIKDLLRQELGKVAIPDTKYVLKIDEIAIHITPIYALQGEAVARRQNDPALNVLFERAAYAADGNLLLSVLALQKVPPGKITQLYQDDRLLPAELRKLPDGTLKPPTVVRRDFDWPGALKGIREKFARDDDHLLQRSRFDDVHFAYSADRKVLHLYVDGVCVHPPALAAEALRDKTWKSWVDRLIPKVSYHVTTNGMVMLTNPSIVWQEDAAAQEVHDGILFHLARFDPRGKLTLGIKLPTGPSRAEALKLIAARPAPAKLLPIDEKNVNFQGWNWKSVLPQAQTRLAQGDFVQHRTRLDRIFFQYERQRGDAILHFDGVNLHPTEVEPAEALRPMLERSFRDLPPIPVDHLLNTARIRFLPSPIYPLQAEAVAQGLDGLLFADGRYDAQGKLHLAVVIATPDQRAMARKLALAVAMPDGVIRPRDAKDQPLLDFSDLAWSDILKQMQAWLARHNDTLMRKTRLDRGFFSYPPNKSGPDLNLALTGIYPKKDALTLRLKKRFADFAQLYLTDQLRAGPVAAVPIIQHLDNPATIVQAKVHEVSALDGVRLDDASFDAEGKLILHGIWHDKRQQAALEKLARATLTPGHPALPRGINWNALQDFDSPTLLHRLRVWVADQQEIDEIWLERLYFDPLGKTRVAGFSARARDKTTVERKLPDLLPVFDSKQLPAIDGLGEEKKQSLLHDMDAEPLFVAFQEPKAADGPVRLDMLPSIAEHLRGQIPKTAVCDGLRIDRCYYDPSGVLRVEGLVDHVAQIQQIKPFLEGNVPFEPARQLAKSWSPGRLTLIPLRPMMVALHEALPALAEFDGVALIRAHHDAKNRLVITATAIGEADAKELTPILRRLLESHPRWRLRTEMGFLLEIKDRRRADPELSKKLVRRALALLQVTIGEARIDPSPQPPGWWSHAWPFDDRLPRVRPTDDEYERCLEYLDAALPHDPKNSLVWYLRGYVLQTKNRADLSLRDFRRMAALELDDPEVRHGRILQLELVQGKLRQSAFRIEQDAILDVSNGVALRVLRESPVARDETR